MKKTYLLFIISIILALTFPLQLVGISTLENGYHLEENVFNPGFKSSALIEENEDEFLEGTMDNLTIDEPGNLKLDINPSNWTNMNPSTPKPSARRDHSMTYHSKFERVVLFGGYDSGVFDDETWVYNLSDNSWTNMDPSTPKPSARYGHSMVYDSSHDRVVLFGGYDSGGNDDETWVYNLSDNSWTNMNPSTSKPSARYWHSMVYNSAYNCTILYGGRDSGEYDDETWVYNLSDNSWTNMNPSSPKPSGRWGHSMVYDSSNDLVVLFGGNDGSVAGYLNDTWVYNLTENTWTNMTSSSKPNGRRYHSMIYDSVHNRVIMFGGDNYYGGFFDDTWEYDFINNSWKELVYAIAPSARNRHDMVYDSRRDRVVLFGGVVGALINDETWRFSDKMLFQQGLFTSKIKEFDSIHTITGEVNWTQSQPLDSSLKLQIGFSTTSNDADFNYMPWQTTNFTFEFHTKYLRYRVSFESSSDIWKPDTPLLNETLLSFTLEALFSDDPDDDDDDCDNLPSNYWIMPGIIGAVVSCAATLGIGAIVLYTKKAVRT